MSRREDKGTPPWWHELLDEGVMERLPVAGISYAAFSVHPLRPGNLLALAVAHRDDRKYEYIIDVVREDISIADAAAVLGRYGISQLVGDVGGEHEAVGHAVAGVIKLLQRGAPCVSYEDKGMRGWRHDLVMQRIRDLSDAKLSAFSAGGIFYGAPESVRDLIGEAIARFEDDDLDAADDYCSQAELEIIARGRDFAAQHPNES
jgi:hypothetical protein